MTAQAHEVLADLRKRFGEHRSTLYASELAQVLGKTTKAIYALKDRGGLPVPVLPGVGRPCVSIHAVADWLSGGDVMAKPVQVELDALKPVPAPKRRRQSMGAYLTTLRSQIDFIHELHAELEKLELERVIKLESTHDLPIKKDRLKAVLGSGVRS